LRLVATALVILMVVVPGTRWLVYHQVAGLVETPRALTGVVRDMTGLGSDQRAEQAIVATLRKTAENRPGDYGTQVAAVVEEVPREQVVARLRSLVPRFANRAAPYARILRYATYYEAHFRRDEELVLPRQGTNLDTGLFTRGGRGKQRSYDGNGS
jgi:hypothetical protein